MPLFSFTLLFTFRLDMSWRILHARVPAQVEEPVYRSTIDSPTPWVSCFYMQSCQRAITIATIDSHHVLFSIAPVGRKGIEKMDYRYTVFCSCLHIQSEKGARTIVTIDSPLIWFLISLFVNAATHTKPSLENEKSQPSS